MRSIDEAELLSMLENMAFGAEGELESLKRGVYGPSEAHGYDIGYYQGRVDTLRMLHKSFTYELEGKALAPRFFV